MAAKKIFISYSRRDTEYVSNLVDAFRKQGFEVWFDKNIRTGTDWDDTIEEELKKADAIVLILSKTSVASENVKDEISYGIGLDKLVIPVKIEECDVPMRLARRQFVDFTTMGHDAGFERLVKDIRTNLEMEEADKKISKGSFVPPKTVDPGINKVAKGSKRIVPYIIGGFVAIILFIVVVLQCVDEPVDNTVQPVPESQGISSEFTDPAWEEAVQSNSIESYIKYVKYAGPSGEYVEEALDSIHAKLPYQGMVLFQDADGNRYFSKLLFTDAGGQLDFGVDDGLPPRKFDILTATGPTDVWDEDDKHVMEGANIVAGDKVEVLTVEYPEDNTIWIKIAFSD